jgi:hypothetical protein
MTVTPNTISGKNRLVFYNDGTQVITITNDNGTNFDGTSMTFVIERADNTEMVTVSGLSSLTNSINVTIPPVAFNSIPNKKWSLRRTLDDSVVMYGPALMQYVAISSIVIVISTFFLPGSTDTYIRPSGGMYLRT